MTFDNADFEHGYFLLSVCGLFEVSAVNKSFKLQLVEIFQIMVCHVDFYLNGTSQVASKIRTVLANQK
jgi:hypothetical protein